MNNLNWINPMYKMNDEESVELQALTGRSVRPSSPSNTTKGSPSTFQIRRHVIKLPVIGFLFSGVILGFLFLAFHIKWYDEDIDLTKNVQDIEEQYKPKCQLLPEDEGPLPVIIMAVGRTGSSITWNTISRMTGFSNIAEELTGGNRNATIDFFSNNITTEVGVHWASEMVCEEQHRVQKEMKTSGIGIAGFQWKPYRPSLRHEFGDGAFHEIAAHSNPSIRVIFLTRNPLDRLLSNLKHKNYQHSDEIPPHCTVDDEECIKRHHQHESAIVLPTGEELRYTLNQGIVLDDMVADKLSLSGVKHIHVTYDKLFKRVDAKEWQRIFKFLGRGPQTKLTMADVQGNFDLAPTSSRSHRDIIANFDDVWESLKGTKYENFVH